MQSQAFLKYTHALQIFPALILSTDVTLVNKTMYRISNNSTRGKKSILKNLMIMPQVNLRKDLRANNQSSLFI